MKKILFLMLLVFNYANAQDLYGTTKAGYIGFGISNATYDDPNYQSWGTIDLEDKSTKGKFILGVFLDDNFTLETVFSELAYAKARFRVGDTYTFQGVSDVVTVPMVADVHISWTGFNLIYGKQVTDAFKPYVKLGAGYWKNEYRYRFSSAFSEFNSDDTDEGFDPVYGLGFDFNLSDDYALGLEYEQYRPGDEVKTLSLNFKLLLD